jgi:hypothetical protein
MANQKHLDILAKGIETWNEWRTESWQVPPDLSGVDLRGANLNCAQLRTAILTNADLTKARLTNSSLHFANLNDAVLRGAILINADLTEARLSNANLTGADLTGAHFDRAHLDGADLSGASVMFTVFSDVDLSTVRGLDSAQHKGPSTIGIDTIYQSHGKIPESFLRGCGVPDNFIAYMRSLTGNAFDFYSCFISYSTVDQGFAERIHADLQAREVRCWFAPHDIQGGKKVHEQIDEAIKVYDKLLLILSDASMSSNWVKTEIANARAKEERQKRQMLFPISLISFDRIKTWKLFDADTGIDSAREIREYFVPDFSNWKDHDIYAKTFDLLVRSLKTDSSRAASERRYWFPAKLW